MGTSTDAIICIGYDLDEDHELPWGEEESEHEDVDDWWREYSGFKAKCFKPFVEGGYAPGVDRGDPRIGEWFAEKRAWDEDHPLPVEVVWHCSYDYPMYVVAIPGSVVTASRGEALDVSDLYQPTPEDIAALKAFMRLIGVEPEGEPKRILCSMWG